MASSLLSINHKMKQLKGQSFSFTSHLSDAHSTQVADGGYLGMLRTEGTSIIVDSSAGSFHPLPDGLIE